MAEHLATLDDVDLAGLTVLIRSDLNVPLSNGEVADDFRIVTSLPTIAEVHRRAERVVVASHLGRPGGYDESLSLAPVATRLAELSGLDVVLAPGVVGPEVEAAVAEAEAGSVVLLENTRFEAGETTNDPNLASGFAALADFFVNDAFGTAHRTHASNVGVAERLPAVAGRLMESEIIAFDRLLTSRERPYVVVMGGAKVSDKLKVIENLLPDVDLMLIGGGMCFTLLKAAGFRIGNSLVEEDMVPVVERLLESHHGEKIVLPVDIVESDAFSRTANTQIVDVNAIDDGWMGLDIGPRSTERFAGAVREAASVFWNGPMGVFEWEPFRAGTEGIAAAIAESTGYTVVGGGDSVAAIRMLGLESTISHVSSGGGAGLAMLGGAVLPGVAALMAKDHNEGIT
ncbi:MAG: phosphoglycerate kinase [Armatimonadetes bacterium]|nr:MAG: phosphoglycerate kinase [Armatimonadota bacterium]